VHYLSAVLLGGLLLNSTLGWSWADPVAALIIAAVAVKEGREAWKGDTCCVAPMAAAAEPAYRTAAGPGEGQIPAATDTPSCSCCAGKPAGPSE
jgi:hypothetical protein